MDDASFVSFLNDFENWFQKLSGASFAVPSVLLALGGHQVLEQGLPRLLGHDIGESFILKEIDQSNDVSDEG